MFIEINNISKKRVNKSIEEDDQRNLKEIFKRVLYLHMFKPDDYAYLDNKYERLFETCLKNRKAYAVLVDLSKDFDEDVFDKTISDDSIYNEKIRSNI